MFNVAPTAQKPISILFLPTFGSQRSHLY